MKKERFFDRFKSFAKKYVLFGAIATSSMAFTLEKSPEKSETIDKEETKDFVVAPTKELPSDAFRDKLINHNVSKSLEYSYQAYLNIKSPNRKKVLRNDYNGQKYCLRTHTLAEEIYNKDMGFDYKDPFWKAAVNRAGCPEFMEYIGYAFPKHMKAKLGKRNDKLRKVAYSPIDIKSEDTKVGDLVFITVPKGKNKFGDITGSGWHAMRVMGHEYDDKGKIVGCAFLTVNGKHEGFRILGEKGKYSTVSMSEYESGDTRFCKNLKGVIVNLSGIDEECLDMKIASSINENMSEIEKKNIKKEIYQKYYGADKPEYADLALEDMYNKQGSEVIAFLEKNNDTYYAENDFAYGNSVREKLAEKITDNTSKKFVVSEKSVTNVEITSHMAKKTLNDNADKNDNSDWRSKFRARKDADGRYN